jgi:hypothetical protein
MSTLRVDNLEEYNTNNGVTIDGVKVKDSAVEVDTISESTSGSGVTIDGVLIKDGSIASSYISDLTGVVQTAMVSTDTEQTIASTTMTAITGLTQTFTPLYSDSKLIHMAVVPNSTTHVVSYGFYKDGATLRTVSTTNSNDTESLITKYMKHTTETAYINEATLLDFETSTGNTTAREYSVRASAGWSGTSYSLYINDRGSGNMGSFSTYIILEVQ